MRAFLWVCLVINTSLAVVRAWDHNIAWMVTAIVTATICAVCLMFEEALDD